MKLKPLAYLLAAAYNAPALAEEAIALNEVVVTAPRMVAPLTVTLDTQKPQQPVPANDGAAFLKTTPGFNVIRKGGTDGDPVFRGLAGSRLNLLMDGTELLGGCPGRMDPPTAYVFPEAFDQITLLKGPQSVAHGNGNLAGVVLFERHDDKAAQPGGRGAFSVTAGSWGRLDLIGNGNYATEQAFVQVNASHAEANDYADGEGRTMNSAYTRDSLSATVGVNIAPDTRLSVDAVSSQAQAEYADRTVDGSQFDRDGHGLKLEKRNLGPLLSKLEALLYYNHVDHVMDNYSLRTPPLAMGMYTASAMDVDRETRGARLSTDLDLNSHNLLKLGADWQSNVHSGRMGMGMAADATSAGNLATASYLSRPKLKDVETRIAGLYGEWRHELNERGRVISGLRHDSWNAERFNNSVDPVVLVRSASENLRSGFVRYEQDLATLPATFYAGLGHAERPMDYWEMKTYNGLSTTTTVPQLSPEKNTQIDTGLTWKTGHLSASTSLFYSRINDYLLTYSGTSIGLCDAGIAASNGRFNCGLNVDATRYGGEADLAWRFAPGWTLRGAVSYVHADNDTLDEPLAQTPPLEGRLGLDFSTGEWTFGGVLRRVARQDRVHVGYGNIVGQDMGETAGFGTLALNMAYRASRNATLTAGIDNVFDTAYAEHLSRADVVDGLPAHSRVYEPGRFIWAKITVNFN